MPQRPLPEVPAVPLVLASASPARLATLRAAGVWPAVVVSASTRTSRWRRPPSATARSGRADVALLLARAKAEDVSSTDVRGAVVLGCDSVLELDGEVHGKPADAAEAARRWRRMRGRSGVLHTGHWLVDDRDGPAPGHWRERRSARRPRRRSTSPSCPTRRSTPTSPPASRCSSPAPSPSTGWVAPSSPRIEGDHHNVVGLSLPLLRELLADAGIEWFDVVGGVDGSDQG